PVPVIRYVMKGDAHSALRPPDTREWLSSRFAGRWGESRETVLLESDQGEPNGSNGYVRTGSPLACSVSGRTGDEMRFRSLARRATGFGPANRRPVRAMVLGGN